MKAMLRIFLILLLSLGAARAEELALSIGGHAARAWLPPGQGPAPLVLFSHGFGGCPAQSRFITRSLAAAGFIVVAPEHADHACGIPGKPEMPFREPENWDPSVFWERRQDLFRTVAALRAGDGWMARIDWDHVGIMGHSLGAYAGLALAGAVPGWKMEGIDAVLAMSPYCTPFIYRGGLEQVEVPVMYQGGSLDRPITPTVKRDGGCFDLTPGPAIYTEIRGAWHLSWTDINILGPSRRPIVQMAVAFFDSALRGRGRVTPVPGLTAFRQK